MPFRKYSRRNYKRSKLSKVNIYTNRGAKAQSKQIAALSRKVNILAKANRPEIRILYRNWSHTFSNGSLAANYDVSALGPWSTSYTGDDQAAGSVDIQGNYCRCKGISVKMVSQYSDNWRDTIADASHDQNAGYRIVILQRKTATPITDSDSSFPSLGDVFNFTSSLSSDDTNLTLPLVSGITATFKVLYSKIFTLSRYHSTRYHNIYIPASKCIDFSRDVNITTSSVIPKGQVYIMVFTGGLHHDIDYTAQISISATTKIAFTDN